LTWPGIPRILAIADQPSRCTPMHPSASHASSPASDELHSLRSPAAFGRSIEATEVARIHAYLEKFKVQIEQYIRESKPPSEQTQALASEIPHLLSSGNNEISRFELTNRYWTDFAETMLEPWRNGLAQLRGKESRLSVGELHVTEKTTPEELLLALASLPSPVLGVENMVLKRPYPIKEGGELRHLQFSTGDSPEIKDAKNLHNRGVRLSERGKFEEAALTFFEAAGRFRELDLSGYAHHSFNSAAQMLTREMDSILSRDADEVARLRQSHRYVEANEITSRNKKEATEYLDLLLYASDSAFKLEHSATDPLAVPIDQGMGGIITDGERAGTGNLRDCHLLVVKTLPWMKDGKLIPSASYLIHNDLRSSAASGSLLDHLLDVPCVAMLAGANSDGSIYAGLNLINAIYSLAATGREVTVIKSHIFRREDIAVTACTYHPDSFVMTLHGPGLTHPDTLISSGWHMHSSQEWQGDRPLSFDTRTLRAREVTNPDQPSVTPEQRFPLPLPSDFVSNIRALGDTFSVAERCIKNPGINIHAGHWVNEADALQRAVRDSRREFVEILLENEEISTTAMERYFLGDRTLASCAILGRAQELPLYIGEGSRRAHEHLSSLMPDALFEPDLESLFDVPFMNTLLHQIDWSVEDKLEKRSTTSFADRLSSRETPLIVHPALYFDLKGLPTELKRVSADVEEFKKIAHDGWTSLMNIVIEKGHSDLLLDYESSRARKALERDRLYVQDLPFFVGPGAEEANEELVDLLVDLATHAPKVIDMFDRFDIASAALVRDLSEAITGPLCRESLTHPWEG